MLGILTVQALLVLFFGGCRLNYRADFIRDVLKWKASISKVEVISAACIRERYSIMMRHYNRAPTYISKKSCSIY